MTYTNDLSGQVLRRQVEGQNVQDPLEVWYRYGGREMGFVGDNGTLNVNADKAIEQRTAEPGTGIFRNGAASGTNHIDFDQNYTALSSYNPGSASGGYTVRGGDTLQGIASGLYGDSSLWYKIAQANGLSGDTPLIEGTTLRLPAGVTRTTYNASTFHPYDPGAAIGDTAPTAPEPPKNGEAGCGVIGFALAAVVAIAVFVVTKDFVSSLEVFKGVLAVVGPAAVAGAVSSAASQGVAIATGVQEKFSFKQVGLAALKAGLTAGASSLNASSTATASSGVTSATTAPQLGGFRNIVRAIGANAITQGIGVATGLQSSFSWSQVAASGLNASGLSSAAGPLGNIPGATQLVNAAERSLRTGNSFGDSLLHEVPDVVGQAFGGVGGPEGGRGPGANARDITQAAINLGRSVVSAVNQSSAVNSAATRNPVTSAPLTRNQAATHVGAALLTGRGDELLVGAGARGVVETGRSLHALGQGLDSLKRSVQRDVFNFTFGGSDARGTIIERRAGQIRTGGSILKGLSRFAPLVLTNHGRTALADQALRATGRAFEDDLIDVGTALANGQHAAVAGFEADFTGQVLLEAGTLPFGGLILGGARRAGNAADAGRIFLEIGDDVRPPNFSVGPQGDTVIGNVARIELDPNAAARARLAENSRRGKVFETNGINGILKHVGLGKNNTPKTVIIADGTRVTTVLDSLGRPVGLVEFKDVVNLSNSNQLRAQLRYAQKEGLPFNLVVSPRNKSISGSLRREIRNVTRVYGGGIYRYDPAVDSLTARF